MVQLRKHVVDSILYHLYTGFLFTKSDIKTTVIPITFFALAAGRGISGARLVQSVFWIWLHLLQFDVSNQTLQPEEDETNKKDRPLPSKRITVKQAVLLRWLLVPACWSLSLMYSMEAFSASVALVTLTIIYDECSAHSGHWLLRNTVNAAGFAAFEVGATLVIGSDRHTLDRVAIASTCISVGIFATTIHAQDFKDIHGDAAIKRQTIPLVFPSISRLTVIVPLLAWSISLIRFWELGIFASTSFVLLAAFVGARYLKYTTVPDDQVSFYWYNVWLTTAHALPRYYRAYGESNM